MRAVGGGDLLVAREHGTLTLMPSNEADACKQRGTVITATTRQMTPQPVLASA